MLDNYVLKVEDVILKSKNLHTELDVTPSSVLYEKIIMHCCDSLKVWYDSFCPKLNT